MTREQIMKEAAAYQPWLTAHRRTLHQIPELGDQEFKTHDYIVSQLEMLQPDEIRTFVGTGVRAVFYGKGNGRVAAFRSDIDALPVTEQTGVDFASKHEGRMHACGHDGHMANLLTFARWIADHREKLADTVVLLFQPSEETTGGAKRMIDEGALENPHVDVIYGMHMMPDVPKGKIACCAGPIMAQTCEMDMIIHGKSAHGATPHLGVDAITAMAHLLTLLQTSIARSVDPCQQALVTVGKVSAGTQRNILCDRAELQGIARTFSNAVYEGLEKRIRADIAGIDAAFGTETEFVKRVFYPCTENDAAEFERVKRVAGDRFIPAAARMTAEDFSYYQLYVPGVFMFCGCMDETHASPLHSCTFNFDETALLPGLETFAGLVNYIE